MLPPLTKGLLHDLLNSIHGDEGEYTQEHGLDTSLHRAYIQVLLLQRENAEILRFVSKLLNKDGVQLVRDGGNPDNLLTEDDK